MTDLKKLIDHAQRLNDHRLKVLVDISIALGREVEVTINEESDLMIQDFVEGFTARLIAYHAIHEQKLTKKTFEYVFQGACQAAGKDAEITANSVNPGADVTVNGIAFSLKTEGARSIKPASITISKLMEARWIRECRSSEDFARESRVHILNHLESYERILVLRVFESENTFDYLLTEIPKNILLQIKNLSFSDFTERTRSGGSSAKVFLNDKYAFTLRLDGSVEKVTLANCQSDLCVKHGAWKISKGIISSIN